MMKGQPGEGYSLSKGPRPSRCARSRSRSLFTRSKSRLATASGSHTFAVAASSSGIRVRPVATSSRNARRSASASESTALEGHSSVDPPRDRNSRRKRVPKVGFSIVPLTHPPSMRGQIRTSTWPEFPELLRRNFRNPQGVGAGRRVQGRRGENAPLISSLSNCAMAASMFSMGPTGSIVLGEGQSDGRVNADRTDIQSNGTDARTRAYGFARQPGEAFGELLPRSKRRSLVRDRPERLGWFTSSRSAFRRR